LKIILSLAAQILWKGFIEKKRICEICEKGHNFDNDVDWCNGGGLNIALTAQDCEDGMMAGVIMGGS